MNFTKLSQNYAEKAQTYDAQRRAIRDRIDQREKQIERLNAKLHKLRCPSWVDELIEPIAKEMIKKLPGRYYDILGPFGMTAETSIHFYKSGVDQDKLFDSDNCLSITFRPGDLNVGELNLVDHKNKSEKYPKGSLGELNGMNYPTISMKKSIDALLAYMTEQKAKVA